MKPRRKFVPYNGKNPMPAGFFDSVTTFINAPPGMLAAGGVLAGIVWKFFKNVGDVLNDETNREIARWIRVKSFETGLIAEVAVSWPETFAKVFDRVFGEKHLSWKCFWRSTLASLAALLTLLLMSPSNISYLGLRLSDPYHSFFLSYMLLYTVFGNIIPDYCSLLETRSVLGFMRRASSFRLVALIGLDFVLTFGFATVGMFSAAALQWTIGEFLQPTMVPRLGWSGYFLLIMPTVPSVTFDSLSLRHILRFGVGVLWFYPAFFTSIWLWLYAGSGFLLKAARRFDIGFDWFNHKFDIEKKPLSAIGLVAGALVAIMYWTVAIVTRLI